MSRRTIYMIVISLIGILNSCQEKVDISKEQRNDILCQLITPEIMTTKGEINQNNLAEATIGIYVYKNGVNFFLPYNCEFSTVKKTENGSVWKLLEPGTTNNTGMSWPENPKTSDNKDIPDEYSFHGFAYNNSQAKDAYIWVDPTKKGQFVKITQPAINWQQTIDYLLSYQVLYTETDNANVSKPFVPIQLEHALTKVTLNLTRKTDVTDLEISFSGIRNQADLTCEKQAIHNGTTDIQNDWIFKTGISTATYSKTLPKATGTTQNEEFMSFIALPADNSIMENYLLSVSYKIGSVPYKRTFKLSENNEWLHGHHVVYELTIDNGVHLIGSIQNWFEVDFIEGTILPPLPPKE